MLGDAGGGTPRTVERRKSSKDKVRKFRCELCSVRLPLVTEDSVKEHMTSKEHLGMKTLLDASLWPGPKEAGEAGNPHQTKPLIYHHDTASHTLYCRLCQAVCPTSVDLLRHQSSIPHLKQMIRNALFAHAVLYFCGACDAAVCPLSVSKVGDHLRSRSHAAKVGGSGWEERMSSWPDADALFASVFDWGIRELVSVASIEAQLSAEEFGVLEVGRKNAWDLPKDPTSESPRIASDITYWEHRANDPAVIRAADVEAFEEAKRKLEQAKGRKVLSHCVDVVRYALRCFPVKNKAEVLVFDPAFFKIYLLGRMSPPAFAVLHRLLTSRLPTRQEGTADLVRFSAKDFVPRLAAVPPSMPSPASSTRSSDAENSHPPQKRARSSSGEPECLQAIPPSPPRSSDDAASPSDVLPVASASLPATPSGDSGALPDWVLAAPAEEEEARPRVAEQRLSVGVESPGAVPPFGPWQGAGQRSGSGPPRTKKASLLPTPPAVASVSPDSLCSLWVQQ